MNISLSEMIFFDRVSNYERIEREAEKRNDMQRTNILVSQVFE